MCELVRRSIYNQDTGFLAKGKSIVSSKMLDGNLPEK
jgi:hypothetical protein